jgi:cytoskeleton protein RodZ
MLSNVMSSDDPQARSEQTAAASDAELSVGQRLRAAREAQPLSLAQVSAALRIEQRFLTALEDDCYDDFSAPVFTKGYIKQYGGLLGLDYGDLLMQYYRQTDARDMPDIQQHAPIRLRDDSQIRHWLAGGAVLVLLGVGAGLWWALQPEPAPLVIDQPAETRPAPPPLPARPQAADLPSTVVPPEATTDAESAAPPAPAPAPEPTPAQAAPSVADPSDGVVVQVELNFREDCWTEISAADGERVLYGLGSAGARSRFNAALPLSIFLGNVSGIDLTVNGQPYPIPADSRQGNLARFVIADAGI